MTKFKVGDKFIPHRPRDNDYAFVRGYWECVLTVAAVEGNTIRAYETDFGFLTKWCEKVEEHIPKPSKTIDWEQRRYEIAKELLIAATSNIVAQPKGSWYYKEKITSAIAVADEFIKQFQESYENKDNSRKKE